MFLNSFADIKIIKYQYVKSMSLNGLNIFPDSEIDDVKTKQEKDIKDIKEHHPKYEEYTVSNIEKEIKEK